MVVSWETLLYPRELTICNFRKQNKVDISFEPGLNIIVGPNNVGKTAVIDALRALLNSHDEPSPRFVEDDIYRPKGGTPPMGLFIVAGSLRKSSSQAKLHSITYRTRDAGIDMSLL
jgi:predicted ATP-dependent endonuclease of OLD family